MKTRMIVLLPIFIGVCAHSLCAGQTNAVTSVVSSSGRATNTLPSDRLIQRMVENINEQAIIKSDAIPLPLQERMDFSSIEYKNDIRWGRDSFFWGLVKTGRRASIGPFIVSEYPLSSSGPNRDNLIAGIGLTVTFKR